MAVGEGQPSLGIFSFLLSFLLCLPLAKLFIHKLTLGKMGLRSVLKATRNVAVGEVIFMVVLTVLQNVDDVPTRILVQLQNTDPALAMSSDKIVKEVERKNLYDAFEIGSIWLEKQLSE